MFCSCSLLRADSCSWNLFYVDFSLLETCKLIFSRRETDFVHGTSCVLIFASRELLCAIFFVRENSCIMIISHRKTYTLIFLQLKLSLFMELVACWFLFVKLVACWFFILMKLLNWFLSSLHFFYSWNLFRADFRLKILLFACNESRKKRGQSRRDRNLDCILSGFLFFKTSFPKCVIFSLFNK